MNSFKKVLFVTSREQWMGNFHRYIRPLYTSSSLGIDSFIERKKKFQKTFTNPDIYKSRLKKACEVKNKGLIFSYDIMNMVHLVENEEDLVLLNKLIKKLCSQNRIKVVKNVYGSEVMRLYYLMNKPSEALALVEDPSLYSEFESITTFILLFELLFKNKLYEEIIRMYEYHMAESSFSIRSYLLNTFYFAACYKMNSETSLNKALNLWKTLIHENYKPGLKIRLLFAALLLKKNQIISAMDVLHMKGFDNIAENLKCLGLVMSKRFKDTCDKIRLNITLEENFFMVKEVVDYLETEVSTSNDENMSQFLITKKELINKNLIIDEPLDKYLCENLEINKKETEKIHRNMHQVAKHRI